MCGKVVTMNTVDEGSGPLAVWAQMARIGFESQAVIAMRIAGMMGLARQQPLECLTMVTEKQEAACESLQAAIGAVCRGVGPELVLAAALQPYGRRTSANSSRLYGARR